jgi:dihydrofolate reductase
MSAMPKLTAIVAMTPGRVIGRDGGLPWHLPGDLAFFKRTTVGHPVVMGRKTWDSIGRPLPKRRNLVLTRDAGWHADGAEPLHAPAELAGFPGISEGDRVFVIGGAAVYEAFMPWLEDLLVSHLHAEHPGDTWFPEFEQWFPCCETVETHPEFTVRRWFREPCRG